MKKATTITLVTAAGVLAIGIFWHDVTSVRCVTSSKRSTQASMPFLQMGLRLYVQEYGALPETTESPEVFKILTGRNPHKLPFCSANEVEHAAGQFLDGWERPYVFQRTAGNMLIRSAGKDGLYHTPDDLTLEALVSKPAKAE